MIPPFVIDLIILGVAVEALILHRWLRNANLSPLIPPAMLFLTSGALLMLAFRGAISGWPAPVLSMLLLLGGVLHVFCLRQVAAAFRRART
ncbi:MAG: hypothetical protein AAF830_15210 [Pseudomonadota bacterium]